MFQECVARSILVQVLKQTEGFMNGNKATPTYYIYSSCSSLTASKKNSNFRLASLLLRCKQDYFVFVGLSFSLINVYDNNVGHLGRQQSTLPPVKLNYVKRFRCSDKYRMTCCSTYSREGRISNKVTRNASRQLVASESQQLSYNSTALILCVVCAREPISYHIQSTTVWHLLCLSIRRCRTIIKYGQKVP